VGAICLLLFGLLGKFGALFATIPEPVMGGVFLVMFGKLVVLCIVNLPFLANKVQSSDEY